MRGSAEKILFGFLMCIYTIIQLPAQDSYFQHFNSSKSYFNPSLVGLSGSLSFNARYRNQWTGSNTGFKSLYLSLEESIPCLPLDWGMGLLQDNEGPAEFKTTEFMAMIAGTFSVSTSNTLHNLKMGISPRMAHKSIDYNKLVFSDQLVPKYGIVQPSSFIPPNGGRSSLFFTPSVGFSLWSLWGKDNPRPISSFIGIAFFNGISITDSFSPIESVQQLGNGARIPFRYSGFLELEFIPFSSRKFYLSINPLIFYHRQSDIDYVEAGTTINLNRDLRIGFFVHKSMNSLNQVDANSYSVNFDVGFPVREGQRADIGFSYSNTLTGFKNFLGPSFELSFSYHFAKSFTCSLTGNGSKVPYNSDIKCPTASFSRAHRKRYENIWYKTIHRKYQ